MNVNLNQRIITERIPQLDGVRALSILLVLGAHLVPLKLPGGIPYFQFNGTAGLMGMSLFFSLSGFLVTAALLRDQDVYAFFVRRLARIIPLAYLFSIIIFFLVGMHWDTLIGHLLFMTNYGIYDSTQYSSHYWSLCVEMSFYAFVGLVVFAAGKQGLVMIPIMCFFVTFLRIYSEVPYAIATHFRVDEILSGGIVAMIYGNYFGAGRSIKTIQTLVKRGLPIWLLLWAISCYVPYSGYFHYIRPYTTALLVFSIILTDNKYVLSFLINGIFSYLAKVSYALYVIHGVARTGIFSGGSPAELYLIKRPATFLITFIGAHLSTFYYEQFWIDKAKTYLVARKTRRERATSNI